MQNTPTSRLLVHPARLDGRVANTAELEPFARGLARVLQNPKARAFLAKEFHNSPVKEQKLELSSLLEDYLQAGAESGIGSNKPAVQAMLSVANEYEPVEVYLPFPNQRASWTGAAEVQVVAILDDDDDPVAFQGEGNRSILARNVAPTVPSVVVTPAEQPFTVSHFASQVCDPEVTDCSGGGSGGAGDPPVSTDTSLYMTHLKIDEDHESIYKGSPEFEVHILGQRGSTDSVTTLQCAGEHAGGPYVFDYNNTSNNWTGNTLLFSKDQLAAYHTAHPGKAFRVFVVEDDDDSCVLRMDESEVESMFSLIGSTFSAVDGAIDTTFNLQKTVKGANAIFNFISKLASWITTKDDLVGTALEDSVVGQYYSGANWIIRGPGNVTEGYMKLEMKP